MSPRKHKSYLSTTSLDLDVVAIHSDLSPHRMAWCLDDTFSSRFVCEAHPFEVTLSSNQVSFHVEFHFEGNETCSPMSLLENKGSSQSLYTGRPTPDYWLVVQESESMSGLSEWLEQLKRINGVQTAYLFPSENHSKLTWLQHLRHL